MPQPTVNLYYAVTFMPWSLKPLYALLADRLPLCGYHFRPWLALSSAGSACCYVLAGTYVDTIAGAFLVTLVRSICNACAEFMLGAVLVNEAREARGGSATTLQAAANACRFAGTFFSAAVGLLLYPCGTVHRRLPDRLVISLTACLPAIVALLAATGVLPELRDTRSQRGVGGEGGGGGGGGGGRAAVALLVLLPLQAAVLWAQACSDTSCALVSPETWKTTLYVLIGLAALAPSLLLLPSLRTICLSRRVGRRGPLEPLRVGSASDEIAEGGDDCGGGTGGGAMDISCVPTSPSPSPSPSPSTLTLPLTTHHSSLLCAPHHRPT